jgi:hypothetical protein
LPLGIGFLPPTLAASLLDLFLLIWFFPVISGFMVVESVGEIQKSSLPPEKQPRFSVVFGGPAVT